MSDCPDGKMDREKMKKMFNMVMTNDDSSDKDSGVRKVIKIFKDGAQSDEGEGV